MDSTKEDKVITKSSEKGAVMVEAAIAMPLYLMCILFIPAIIPFMFNMLGAHYASVISLREVSTGFVENGTTLEQHLHTTLQNNLKTFTTGITLDNVTIGRITMVNGQREEVKSPASCLEDATCKIPSGGYLTISTDIRFINMSNIGLSDYTSTTLALMKMSDF